MSEVHVGIWQRISFMKIPKNIHVFEYQDFYVSINLVFSKDMPLMKPVALQIYISICVLRHLGNVPY
jgi:hypothetical protein